MPPLLRILLALVSLFLVVAVGLAVLLPRVCGEGAPHARLPGAASSAVAHRIDPAESGLALAGSIGVATSEKSL